MPTTLQACQEEIERLIRARLQDQLRWMKLNDKLQRDVLSLKGHLKAASKELEEKRAKVGDLELELGILKQQLQLETNRRQDEEGLSYFLRCREP